MSAAAAGAKPESGGVGNGWREQSGRIAALVPGPIASGEVRIDSE